VSATASSALTVSFSTASTACTVTTGGLVHIVSGGGCAIDANQAGNTNYNAAPQVSQSFTISKMNQTITFGALSGKTFGDADFSVSATASSALTVSFSTASTACTVTTGGLVHIVSGGGCAIDANQAGNTNYNPAPPAGDENYNAAAEVSQTFTIAKTDQTITFGALSGKTFGDADFSVSASASSGLVVSFTAGATDQCTVTGTSVHLTGAGSCTITAHQAGDGNYNAAPDVPQTFAIAKSDQTITFGA